MEKKPKEKIDIIEEIHPMRQITIASFVQLGMFGFMLLSFFTIDKIFADEMVHQFKNPIFSGIGT